MHWLSQREPIRGPNRVDMLMWESLSSVVICAVTPLGPGPRDVSRGMGILPLAAWPCLRTIDSETNRSHHIKLSWFCDVPPSSPWRFVWTVFAVHLSSWAVSMLSLKCRSLFNWYWVRDLSSMTHFNTMAMFHSCKGSAQRFSERLFKMLSERYVTAIKPVACGHSLLSFSARVFSVASPLLQPWALVLGLHYHICRMGCN